MEYILINESKLKITLEKSDLESFDISVDELDYGNPYAKTVFEEILAYSKDNFGFDTTGHKVLLQLYPSKDGGCELFITRLCESTELRTGEITEKKKRHKAYSFEKLSSLLSVCKLLCSEGFSGESSAWFDDDGKWFLLLSLEGEDSDLDLLPIDKFSFICEYGEAESPKSLSLYLFEYAHPICQGDATLVLGKI